jgi:hypothetical protein
MRCACASGKGTELEMTMSPPSNVRASPANARRMPSIAEWSATIAATPTEMHRKKKISRRDEARSSRAVMRSTKVMPRA